MNIVIYIYIYNNYSYAPNLAEIIETLVEHLRIATPKEYFLAGSNLINGPYLTEFL